MSINLFQCYYFQDIVDGIYNYSADGARRNTGTRDMRYTKKSFRSGEHRLTKKFQRPRRREVSKTDSAFTANDPVYDYATSPVKLRMEPIKAAHTSPTESLYSPVSKTSTTTPQSPPPPPPPESLPPPRAALSGAAAVTPEEESYYTNVETAPNCQHTRDSNYSSITQMSRF